jgi:hypothetical protein
MAQTEGPRPTRTRLVVASLAGLVVFALLFQWGGGVDTEPPECFGMFGFYSVPCGGWPAVAAGIATAAVVYLVLSLRERRR